MKIYEIVRIVDTTSMYIGKLETVEKVFMNKVSAEYYLWDAKKNTPIGNVYAQVRYIMTERDVSFDDYSKEKDFKKFCDTKQKEIEAKIEEERKCSNSDIVDIARLEEEKLLYR